MPKTRSTTSWWVISRKIEELSQVPVLNGSRKSYRINMTSHHAVYWLAMFSVIPAVFAIVFHIFALQYRQPLRLCKRLQSVKHYSLTLEEICYKWQLNNYYCCYYSATFNFKVLLIRSTETCSKRAVIQWDEFQGFTQSIRSTRDVTDVSLRGLLS